MTTILLYGLSCASAGLVAGFVMGFLCGRRAGTKPKKARVFTWVKRRREPMTKDRS